jgi:hypothetical protein
VRIARSRAKSLAHFVVRYLEMCEEMGCISSRVLLLHETVAMDQWPDLLEACCSVARADDAARVSHTVVVFDVGGALTKASFVTFLDWKQKSGSAISWQAYTNVGFSALKFSNDRERSVVSNNFILCPERDDACQGATHLRMRLADALWTTVYMASRL